MEELRQKAIIELGRKYDSFAAADRSTQELAILSWIDGYNQRQYEESVFRGQMERNASVHPIFQPLLNGLFQ